MTNPGKLLIIVGLAVAAGGVLFTCFPALLTWFGRLPGDINIKRDNFSLYMPLTSCLLLSALFSAITWLIKKW